MKTHKDLEVWKKSIDLVEEIYKLTQAYPKSEQYGLISQIRRAVVSVPANIAEGAARKSNKEFIHFLYISLGSLSELETHMIISERLSYIDSLASVTDELDEIRRMLQGLVKYLQNSDH